MLTLSTLTRIFFCLVMAVFLVLTGAPQRQATAALSPVKLVVVYKSRNIMPISRGNEIVRTYNVALGRDPLGHKQKAGDDKTPEGSYNRLS